MLLMIPFPGAAFILTSNKPKSAAPTVSRDVQSSVSLYVRAAPPAPYDNGPLHCARRHPSGRPSENLADNLAGSAMSFGHARKD
jgi:hypothetical protein